MYWSYSGIVGSLLFVETKGQLFYLFLIASKLIFAFFIETWPIDTTKNNKILNESFLTTIVKIDKSLKTFCHSKTSATIV